MSKVISNHVILYFTTEQYIVREARKKKINEEDHHDKYEALSEVDYRLRPISRI